MATAADTDRTERLVLTLRMLAHPITTPAGLSDSERAALVQAAAELERLAGLAGSRDIVDGCGCPGCEGVRRG